MIRLRLAATAARGRFETLETRLVLSAASLADISLVAHGTLEEGGCSCGCCSTCTGGHAHDDHLHGVDAYGNEYHAIPLVDFNRLSLNNYPDLHQPVKLEGLAETFHLHSNSGASKTIFLDFTGYTTSGTYWNSSFNNGNDIVTAAYDFDGNISFSDTELERIQRIWQRVAEDFAPFDVNVTTADPGTDDLRNTGGADSEWGIRVVIGGNGSWYGSAGGVAYLTSFTWSTDTPVFVFEDNLGNGHERYTAEAISHEVGHALGLSHDGTSSVGYYTGHGSGETGWAPIMGVGYYQQLTQWSQGEYDDADNSQDDLSIIVSNNGFGYRADDHGDANGSASWLTTDGINVSGEGLIEQNTDVDVLAFATTGGNVNLSFDEAAIGANLDIGVELYNASNQLVASSNPTNELGASLNLNLDAGEYYIHITGVGKGDPSTTGYSDYGSLGQYSISGTVDGLVDVDATGSSALEGPAGFAVDATDSGELDDVFSLNHFAGAHASSDLRFDQAHVLPADNSHQFILQSNSVLYRTAAHAIFTAAGETGTSSHSWREWDEVDAGDWNALAATADELAWLDWDRA